MGLIKSINHGYTMAPNDWQMLFKLILMSAQYTVWLTEWEELTIVQTMDNIVNAESGVLDEVLGQGTYATPAAQTNLACAVLKQSSELAIKALKIVPVLR